MYLDWPGVTGSADAAAPRRAINRHPTDTSCSRATSSLRPRGVDWSLGPADGRAGIGCWRWRAQS